MSRFALAAFSFPSRFSISAAPAACSLIPTFRSPLLLPSALMIPRQFSTNPDAQLKLYVGNLPWGVDNQGLLDLFSEHNPTSTTVATTKTGLSRGFGFVSFDTSENREAAKSALNGLEIEGRTLNVSNRHARGERPKKRKVYLGNLSWGMDVVELQEVCGKFGDIENAVVVADRSTGLSRGFAFVTMKSEEAAADLISNLDQMVLDGRVVYASLADTTFRNTDRESPTARGNTNNGCRVFLGNLTWNMEVSDLQELCGQFGQVNSARIITDRESGLSRGFGFVTMDTAEEAQKLISEMDSMDVDGRVLQVSLAGSDKDKNKSEVQEEEPEI
eukprot:TRINITY_DN26350_c0_g1_i2.p1 TRINITY_DN26350_c0_g1~~TRINITY_DN26350_c0_g1_i2.p1  ORF type:complete len:331 (+),score=51.52 TRINITY_DN26350_c0_g1_i2:206-1198(+)